MNKIRKGDEVIVTTGRDKGRRGTVLRVFEDGRLLIEGINVSKKHQKANPNQGVQGGIIDKEMPIAFLERAGVQPENQEGRPRRNQNFRQGQGRQDQEGQDFQVQRRDRRHLNFCVGARIASDSVRPG